MARSLPDEFQVGKAVVDAAALARMSPSVVATLPPDVQAAYHRLAASAAMSTLAVPPVPPVPSRFVFTSSQELLDVPRNLPSLPLFRRR